jgi:hypothetical protein
MATHSTCEVIGKVCSLTVPGNLQVKDGFEGEIQPLGESRAPTPGCGPPAVGLSPSPLPFSALAMTEATGSAPRLASNVRAVDQHGTLFDTVRV